MRRFPPVLLLLALLFSAAPSPGSDEAASCFATWWREEVAAIAREPESPRSFLRITRLARLAVTAADPGELHAALDHVRSDVSPLLAAEIDRLLLDADLDRGDLEAAARRRARLGIVGRWLLAGPRNPDETPPPPPAPGAPTGEAPWRVVPADPRGNVPLHLLLSPARERRASLLTYIHAERKTRVALHVGADDAAEIHLDGHPLLATGPDRDFAPDQEALLLDLAPGWHRLRIEAIQEDGPWIVTARLAAPDGGPVPAGVRWDVPEQAPRLAPPPRKRRGRRGRRRGTAPATLADLFSGRDGREENSAIALAARATWLSLRRLPSRGVDEATTLVRRAAALAPRDPDVLWASWQVEDDPSRGREALEKMLEAVPGHPAALRTLVRYDLAYGREDEALALAGRGLAACDGRDPFLAAWMALARDERGFPGGALAALRRIARDAPRHPVVLERIGALARRVGLPGVARRAWERYLAMHGRDDEVRVQLLRLLEDAADVPAALRVLERARELRPLDVTWTTRTADLLLGLGRPDEARRLVARHLALAPGNPDLLRLAGEAALASGEPGAAVAAFRELVDRGLDTGHYAERIAALTGSEDTFGEAYAIEPGEAQAIEAEHPLAGDPEAVVVSQVTAWRLQPSGLATRFHQVLIRVRHPEQADWLRAYGVVSWSPALRSVRLLEAKIVRADGSILPAERRESSLLRDPELRMWYDTRQLQALFPRFQEGDLLEIRYRVTDRGPANPLADGYFGDIVVLGRNIPVLRTLLVIDAPEGLPVHRDLLHLPGPAREEELPAEPGRKVRAIRLGPLPALRNVPWAPPREERAPVAVLGTVDTWDHLGALYARLLEDASHPDADIRAEVRKLLADRPSRREAVRRIYEWVLENTRYVALELGIHAVKPYDVKAVFRRRHGDCKDKAALMVTMLRLAGIDAHVALLRSRDRGDFAAQVPTFAAFDHAIVRVEDPDLWLDGTVLHYGLGELPGGDRGALALVVDENPPGGRLVTTPAPRPDDSVSRWEEDLLPERDGAAQVRVSLVARGEAAARERSFFRLADRPRAVLASRLRRRWPDVTLLDARIGPTRLRDAEVSWWASLRDEGLGRREQDGTVSFPLALHVPRPQVQPPSPGREVPVRLPLPWHVTTDARWKLPPGVELVDLPRPVRLSSPWVSLDLSVREGRAGVQVRIDLVFRGGDVAPADFGRFSEILRRVREALDQRIVTRWLP